MSQSKVSIWPISAENPDEYRHAKLLQTFMKEYPIANDSIRYYNHFIDKRLAEIISASVIRIKGPNKEITPYFYRVSLVRVEMPSRQIQVGPNTISVPITPAYCRMTNTSLTAEIFVSLGLYQDGSTQPIQVYRDPNDPTREGSQVACAIPVELGSKLDHAARNGMSPEARLAAGECPSDTGGNFYIDGPRTPQIVDKLALEQCLIIPDPKTGNYNCSFTSTGIIKSIQVVILMGTGENQGQFRFYLNIIPFKNPESTKTLHTVNFLVALRIMTGLSHQEVVRILEQFYPTQISQAERVKRTLLFTTEASQAIPDELLIEEIRANLNAKSDYTLAAFRNTLITQAFPEYTSLDTKVYTLCYMGVRYAEYMAGFRAPDNRDAYDHKNFQMAPTQLEVDFRRLWRKVIETVSIRSVDVQINQQARNRVLTPDELFQYISSPSTLTMVIGQITSWTADMTGDLSKLFTSSLTNRFSGLTMVDPTDVKTPQAIAANVTKIGVAVEKHSYGEGIRLINREQTGFVCIVMTPEGQKNGLVKYKALTCLISMPTNPSIILLLIENIVEPHIRKPGYSALLINGMFQGWVNGEQCYSLLRNYKRQGNIIDVSITFDGSVVSVYTTTSRLVRPLLIINPITQQLVIEEKDMWDAPFPQLLKEGCVEFLDPAETLFAYVAQSYGYLLNQRYNLTKLKGQLDLLIPIYQYITQTTNLDVVTLNRVLTPEVQALFSNEMINQINLERDSQGFTAIVVREIQTIYKRISEDYARQLHHIKYTHCEVDPSAIMGVIASVCPYPEHEQGPRVPLNSGMEKQVVGTNHPFVRASMELSTNFTQMASPSIVSTQVEQTVFSTVPNSRTPMVAIMPYKGYNQEDAMVVKAEAVAGGLFSTINYTVLRVMELVRTGGASGVLEYISPYSPDKLNDPNVRWEKPVKPNVPPPGAPPGSTGIYDKLDKSYGIVMPGSQVGPGDCLVFRIRKINRTVASNRNDFYEDASLYVPDGYSGRVDAVVVTNNTIGKSLAGSNGRTISIRLVNYRSMKVGDKAFASYSQKSTVSLIEPKSKLPYTKRVDGSKGFSPDIFVSPMTIPSRMTIGMMIEAIMNKAIYASGSTSPAFTDATGFRRHIPKEDLGNAREYRRYVAEAMKVLEVNGYRPDGTEILYDVDDQGKEFQIKTPITVAPIRYRLLPHRATSKAQVRSAGGPIRRTTRQPRGGKARGSGLRVGEMERDAIISFGASNVLREELCLASDSFRAVFCVRCGVVAIVDYQNTRIECKRCGALALLDVVQQGKRRRYTVQDPDRAGQDFCISTIPYIMLYISNLLGGAMLDFRLGFD